MCQQSEDTGEDSGNKNVESITIGTLEDQEPFPWHLGVYDAHCHPTTKNSSVALIPNMKARILTVMSTRDEDQFLADEAAEYLAPTGKFLEETTRIIPCFGWHPYFSHELFDDSQFNGKRNLSEDEKILHYNSILKPQPESLEFIRSLPDPKSFSQFISETRTYLQKHHLALVGEVGLDKSFRLPEAWTEEDLESRDKSLILGVRGGRNLTPCRVNMAHQKRLLEVQLRLAGELQRPVSVHGVQAHGMLFDTFRGLWKGHEIPSRKGKKKLGADRAGVFDEETVSHSNPKPYPPRICLHSYSGPLENVKQYFQSSVPAHVFVSFSSIINFSTAASAKSKEVLEWLPEDRILIESDLHKAGDIMDEHLEEIARIVCRIRGWTLEEGVKKFGHNWKQFIIGS
jgi:Tat protein secretion system quality control protein TatD with DNase activity